MFSNNVSEMYKCIIKNYLRFTYYHLLKKESLVGLSKKQTILKIQSANDFLIHFTVLILL